VIVRRPLVQLRPKYIATEPGRYGMGISIRCPREEEPDHRSAWDGDHRLEFWFSHPDDGFGPNHDRELFNHMGSLNDLLTVYPSRLVYPEYLITVPLHWRGYIIEGVVYDAITVGGVP
jgi:hypothetical protein